MVDVTNESPIPVLDGFGFALVRVPMVLCCTSCCSTVRLYICLMVFVVTKLVEV